MYIVFTSFKHPKLPISIKFLSHYCKLFIYFHDSFISKFELMNYLFANLLVAWLYTTNLWYFWDPNFLIIGKQSTLSQTLSCLTG